MDQKQVGLVLAAVGAAILVSAAVLSITSSPDEPLAGDSPILGTTVAVATTATASSQAPATTVQSTSIPAPILTTTTAWPTTTTTAPTTTTMTIADTDLVEAFIVAFGEALESGDVEFVFASLHPGIVFGFGTEVCRTWVETQVMGISAYVQIGPVIGPTSGSLGTPGGDASFEVVYSAPVTFEFSGATFAANPDFVLEDGTVYFTGACEA